MNNKQQKVILIVGPTASGKSDLGVYLARKIDGEIISADSRQVYKGLNIGSGKISKKEMRGVNHHLLSIASPTRTYTASQYKRDGKKALKQIFAKNKIPIIVGGTGFYIDTLLGKFSLPEVKPNLKLRKQLEKKSTEELFKILKKLDPKRAGDIERQNPRRLIRAIEIATALGSVPALLKADIHTNSLWIGLNLPEDELRKNIQKRLEKRLSGIVREVKKLRRTLSWKKLGSFGLEYRYISQFLQGKISKEEAVQKIETGSWRYSRRQLRWWKRNKDIKWFNPKDRVRILKTTQKFLS